MAQVACLGECMIELREMADGRFSRGYGGDTLNTAVYLARLGVAVDYVTALGDDLWSDEMLAGWAAEGVGTGRVARLPGRVPGLYIIQTPASSTERPIASLGGTIAPLALVEVRRSAPGCGRERSPSSRS